MDIKDLTKTLTAIWGPSGNEADVNEKIVELIKDDVDEIKRDGIGSLIALKKGTAANPKKVMFAAHTDQIGLMVTHIEKEGFLRVGSVGGIIQKNIIQYRVVFKNGVEGIVYYEDKKDKFKLSDMVIDIGATSKEEAEKMVNIGDIAVFKPDFSILGNCMVCGAMDDRIGCAILIDAITKIKDNKDDLYFAFTVQEELGTIGGRVSAYDINPDYGVAVDITLTGDTPKTQYRIDVNLGEGVAIKVKDSSLMAHPIMKKWMIDACKAEGIDYQMEILPFGGTDAGAISLARSGVPAGCISVPTRYGHSNQEMVNLDDVRGCVDLIVAMATKNYLEV